MSLSSIYRPNENVTQPSLNSVMAKLAVMDPRQLQAFAAAHEHDPIMLSAAQAVKNKHDEFMQQKMAMQNGAPPPVNQQVVQQMAPQPAPQPMPPQMPPQGQQAQLPENVGIGQLPAQNIQNMAAGGIVAFGDGGEVQHFADTGAVKEDMPAWLRALPEDALARVLYNAAKNKKAGEGLLQLTPPKYKAAETAATVPAAPEIAATPPQNAPALYNSTSTAPTGNIAGTRRTPEEVAASLTQPPTDRSAAPAPSAPPVNSFANQVAGIEAFLPKKEAAQSEADFLRKREEVSKPVWDKFQSTIDKEKSRLSEGKEQDFYMSLIEGGLAAAGGTSQYGLQNLAQGFSKGAASFRDALKDFRKASQENARMELDMERAKAAEKRGDMDAYQRYEDSIKNRNADIDKLKTSGIFSLQNVHTAGQYQQQAAATTAAGHVAAAKLPGAQERLFATLGGGNVMKGLKIFQEAQTDKTGAAYAKMYSDYAANADKTGAEKMSPVEFAQNMQQFMSAMQGGGFQQKPASSTIRKLPGT